MLQEETIQVTGIRCERCVNRLALALDGHPGLSTAQANLVGQVYLAWDDDATTRDDLVDKLADAGFHEA